MPEHAILDAGKIKGTNLPDITFQDGFLVTPVTGGHNVSMDTDYVAAQLQISSLIARIEALEAALAG